MYYPRLKELRDYYYLSQKQVAELLGIDQRVYSTYELGKREIPTHFLITLAERYHCSLDFIVGRSDDKSFMNEKEEE